MEKDNKIKSADKIQIICNIINTFLIGTLTLYIGWKANIISKSELELARAQSYAQFVVKQTFSTQDELVPGAKIEISCQDGYFTNYKSNAICLMKIVCADNKTYKIPLIGYWFLHQKSGNMDGIIETIFAKNNEQKYEELKNVLQKTYNDIYYIELEHYLNISYYDCTQTTQQRFYQVAPIIGTTIIEKSAFELENEHYEELRKNNCYIDLDFYTEETIKELIKFKE